MHALCASRQATMLRTAARVAIPGKQRCACSGTGFSAEQNHQRMHEFLSQGERIMPRTAAREAGGRKQSCACSGSGLSPQRKRKCMQLSMLLCMHFAPQDRRPQDLAPTFKMLIGTIVLRAISSHFQTGRVLRRSMVVDNVSFGLFRRRITVVD